MSAAPWRIGIQMFAAGKPAVDLVEFIPIFHGWIQTRAVDGLLIDVADYSHVVDGPGIVLVGHEGNYGVERSAGRLALVYTRKQPIDGDLAARIDAVAAIAMRACRVLEAAHELGGRVRFEGGAVRLFANDRLLAPNDAETAARLGPAFEAGLQRLLGGAAVRMQAEAETRERFSRTARSEDAV